MSKRSHKRETFQIVDSKNHVEFLKLKEKQKKIAAKIPDEVKGYSKLVGNWIWIELPLGVMNFRFRVECKLKRLGFFYNPRRRAWQHNCGLESERSRSDPRRRYVVSDLFRGHRKDNSVLIFEQKEELKVDNYTPF